MTSTLTVLGVACVANGGGGGPSFMYCTYLAKRSLKFSFSGMLLFSYRMTRAMVSLSRCRSTCGVDAGRTCCVAWRNCAINSNALAVFNGDVRAPKRAERVGGTSLATLVDASGRQDDCLVLCTVAHRLCLRRELMGSRHLVDPHFLVAGSDHQCCCRPGRSFSV